MQIITEIARCAAEYEVRTGIKPTRVYLGRGEMLALMKWAYAIGYKTEPTTTTGESPAKLGIMGLMVYEVNDDEPHMQCYA